MKEKWFCFYVIKRYNGIFWKTGMLITEPNGVPSITCPGCDIWLLMENHISMGASHKMIAKKKPSLFFGHVFF